MKQGIALFEQKQVRKIWYNNQWYFSIVDVIEILTESTIPKRYWTDLKSKLLLEGSEVYEKIVRFKMMAPDGKMRETDCFSTSHLLRIIQSIPSPKAEPFKQRLAKVGYERIQEINDPELDLQRMRELYEKKGYPKNRIEKRERGIAVRHTLTDEWKLWMCMTRSDLIKCRKQADLEAM
ncbi:MAG: Bro-N domain-containing protein [Candidatus Absconditabacterales bacterium]